jgi:hypothetical protein
MAIVGLSVLDARFKRRKSDVASFFNVDGSLKTPAELDEDQRTPLVEGPGMEW